MSKEILKVSHGNRKMGEIPSVSLPPVITCRKNAPCIKDCYACKLCRIYKNVAESYKNNYELYNTDPDSYFRQLDGAMKMSLYFRVHVSGDVPTMDYFNRLVEVVKNNPHCKVLMFTKQFEIVNAYISENGGNRETAIPENFKIIYSAWQDFKPINPYNFPETNVIFPNTQVPDNWKICGGNCSECVCRGVGCWELKAGETLAFYKH